MIEARQIEDGIAMSIKENWTFQPEVLAEVYTAMEFATQVGITYKIDNEVSSIQGDIHYLDCSTHHIRVIDRNYCVQYIPLASIVSLKLIK